MDHRGLQRLHHLLGQAFYELEQKRVLRNPAAWANVPKEAADAAPAEDAAEGADTSAHARPATALAQVFGHTVAEG